MEQIEKLRNRIDGVDRKIVELLEDRVDIARKIGKIKKKNKLKISDLKREHDIIKNVSDSDIDKKFVKKLFKMVIGYCKDEEKN